VKITFVKGTFLIPFLLLLVYLGGFSVKNSFGDLILVILFGALGWFMVQTDWPRPPLLLGIVLGEIAENNLFIATRIYGAALLIQPGVIVIGLLILGALAYPLFKAWKQRQAGSEKPQVVADIEMTVILRRSIYGPLFALFFVGVFAFVVRDALFGYGVDFPRSAIFPLIIGSGSLVLALLAFGWEFWNSLRGAASDQPTLNPGMDLRLARRRTAAITGWIVGFFLGIWLLGFAVTSALATFLYLKLEANEKWPISSLLSLVAWAFFYGLFDYFLHLPFPEGQIFYWLKDWI